MARGWSAGAMMATSTCGTPLMATQLLRLVGHHGAVKSVGLEPDGCGWPPVVVARAGRGGEVFVWDAHSGQRVLALAGISGVVSALSWASSGELVLREAVTGFRWWEVQSGQCVRCAKRIRGPSRRSR